MLNREETNTNFIVLGLTRPGLEPTIYRTRGEHAIHYAIDTVILVKETGVYPVLLTCDHDYDGVWFSLAISQSHI